MLMEMNTFHGMQQFLQQFTFLTSHNCGTLIQLFSLYSLEMAEISYYVNMTRRDYKSGVMIYTITCHAL